MEKSQQQLLSIIKYFRSNFTNIPNLYCSPVLLTLECTIGRKLPPLQIAQNIKVLKEEFESLKKCRIDVLSCEYWEERQYKSLKTIGNIVPHNKETF